MASLNNHQTRVPWQAIRHGGGGGQLPGESFPSASRRLLALRCRAADAEVLRLGAARARPRGGSRRLGVVHAVLGGMGRGYGKKWGFGAARQSKMDLQNWSSETWVWIFMCQNRNLDLEMAAGYLEKTRHGCTEDSIGTRRKARFANPFPPPPPAGINIGPIYHSSQGKTGTLFKEQAS